MASFLFDHFFGLASRHRALFVYRQDANYFLTNTILFYMSDIQDSDLNIFSGNQMGKLTNLLLGDWFAPKELKTTQ